MGVRRLALPRRVTGPFPLIGGLDVALKARGRQAEARLGVTDLLNGVLLAILVMGLGDLGGGIWVACLEGEAWCLAAAVLVAGIAGACVFGAWRFIVDEYRNPTRFAAGWDWL